METDGRNRRAQINIYNKIGEARTGSATTDFRIFLKTKPHKSGRDSNRKMERASIRQHPQAANLGTHY